MMKYLKVLSAPYDELVERVAELSALNQRMEAALQAIIARQELNLLDMRLAGSVSVDTALAYSLANKECAAIAQDALKGGE